ncbi:OPT/YSL family transporter [Candidatus Dependentiae bacterium]|nr:OPT/YSL family transporter [Candidatus Dependentiae bacterium]
MRFLTVVVSILFSFFSTAIMSYIAMATVIGPWIETTLVLAGLLIFYGFKRWYSDKLILRGLGLSTAAGGIGGILATGCGFSFPTLFFIDNGTFCTLLHNPFLWVFTVGSLAFAAGSLGLVAAHVFEHSLLVKQNLPFPIGELVYKMMNAADSMQKACMLAMGLVGTNLFLFIRSLIPFLSKPLVLLSKHSWSIITVPHIAMQTDLLPMFLAIGFITGHVIAIPLLLGMLAKIFCIEPLYRMYPLVHSFLSDYGISQYLGTVSASSSLSLHDFTIAFCSGMVLYGASMSFFDLPRTVLSAYRNMFKKEDNAHAEPESHSGYPFPWLLVVATVSINLSVFYYFQFSLLAQLYLLVFTFICTYQMLLIAGKIGLAPLGRFATFVLVPGMFMFGYTPLQITLVSMYVEIAGGVACDALFGRKMAHLAGIDRESIHLFQWLGLLISCIVVGIVMWIFINHFGIGLEPGALASSKAASRALLVNVKSFDVTILGLGILFGYLLKMIRVNAVLMLGGILMSADLSTMLVLGGLSTYLVADKERYYPLWSGVFAANSLWMLVKAFF